MFSISRTFIGIFLFIVGSSCNSLCVLVFLRKKFRYRIITPYFIILLFADSIYLLFSLLRLNYYADTLFKPDIHMENTFFTGIYEHVTQNLPQLLVPLVHPKTYMRFSFMLMSIMSVQRTIFITRSLKLLVLPTLFKDIYKYKRIVFIILLAFIIAYIFELSGLTLFCSKSIDKNMTYNWFIYMNKHMKNATVILTNTMSDQPNALKCVNYVINNFQQNETSSIEQNPVCTKEELINILSYYFDKHDMPIVNLIHKIHSQTGDPISRNEIRRKYHFHECLFTQESNFFHRHYDHLYSRLFGLNRYTLLLVFGTIIPSLITILSNIISVYRVQELNRLTTIDVIPCRRRTDDTRRILIVITVECLFAIVNSWFGDTILSLVYCKRKISAHDDCPMFLSQNIKLYVMFDMINTVSNIILHCLCGKCFRNELLRMLSSSFYFFKRLSHDIWCCYCQIDCRKPGKDDYVTANASIVRPDSSHSSNSATNYIYFKVQSSPSANIKQCCACRWYCNRKPLMGSQQFLQRGSTPYVVRYGTSTQRSYIIRQTTANSMRLYHPPLQTTAQIDRKNRFLDCR